MLNNPNKIQIIAEAATNHNGDIALAKEMVHAAKEAGADYIKFQSWQIKSMKPDNPAYQMMRPKEIGDNDHASLIEECKKAGIQFLTTCFDIERIDFLASLGLEKIKVASTDVGSGAMLGLLRRKFKTIILSTGMSYEKEIAGAVNLLKNGDFYLLHCVSLYPTPPGSANLARINWLKKFTPNVGYSDHTLGTEAAKIAIAMGAMLVEKHFTLKRDPSNIFSNLSALPADLKEICDFSRNYELMLGRENPDLTAEEKEARKKFIGRWGDNR
jgi:sialic acid synthase SpsE